MTERRLYSVEGNTQKLDGGAMFGNAPKPLWERWASPDERNRIDLACRALLVKEPDRWNLLETGIGAFINPKMRDRFGSRPLARYSAAVRYVAAVSSLGSCGDVIACESTTQKKLS